MTQDNQKYMIVYEQIGKNIKFSNDSYIGDSGNVGKKLDEE